jgi:hypothetical protein
MASTVEEGETECSQRHQTLVQTRSRRSAFEATATPNGLASMCAIRAGFPHHACWLLRNASVRLHLDFPADGPDGGSTRFSGR